MMKTKFVLFHLEDCNTLLNDDEINYEEVKIKNPNSPSEMMSSVLLRYDKKLKLHLFFQELVA